ncbi:hypothetical protein FACS1894110_18130 [Spirochaetia bacterium]|nr:hypothetical protein FACS1894110_18130 [Spirochaetia bacterium]
MEELGQARKSWFKTFLELPNGIPDEYPFERVFRRVNPKGSFTIATVLNPIGDNEVNTDDSIYLQHISDNEEWPMPREAHKLILDALEGNTQDGCESKISCVRVLYRNVYHLDLPVYIMDLFGNQPGCRTSPFFLVIGTSIPATLKRLIYSPLLLQI